jgi:flagellar motor switch/type III secretory pathway protein FliN
MSTLLCWMPEESLRLERATDPVRQVLADWSAKWLGEGRCEAEGTWEAEGERDGAGPLLHRAEWLIYADKGAVMRIGRAMLGEEQRTDFTPADLRLLRRIAGEALDDLGERLGAILSWPAGAGEMDSGLPWSLTVSLSEHPCLHLTLDRSDLVRLVRQTFTPGVTATLPDAPLSAVADFPVPVAGRLGSASLQVDQIGSLEPGDVLLLDQLVDDPLTLVVAGFDSPLRCAIAEADGVLDLIISEIQ